MHWQRPPGRASLLLLAVTCGQTPASLSGCMLIGYEPLSHADTPDAEVSSPLPDAEAMGLDDGASERADADENRGDAAPVELTDASSDGSAYDSGGAMLLDAEADADSAAGPDASDDGGADASHDAGADASDDAGGSPDGGVDCSTRNACGGCSALSHAPGSACGVCGLGQYVCDGTDAVFCEGGDALPKATGGSILIDDLEDGDRFIRPVSGLNGSWYTVSDDSKGTLNPPVGSPVVPVYEGASGSARSVRVSGHGFAYWGAGLAVTLSAYQCRYDASAQHGVGFSAKGSGNVIISVATRQTTPTSAGGTCVGGGCNDHFATTLPLTGNWTWRAVPWFSLRQAGWGTPATFSASEILYLQFSFGANTTFDLYVDDLSFY